MIESRRTLAVLALLACVPAASAQMSHEETMVRTAYAKFAYAVQLGAISHLAMDAETSSRCRGNRAHRRSAWPERG